MKGLLIAGIAFVAMLFLLAHLVYRLAAIKKKFKPIIDLENEKEFLSNQILELKEELSNKSSNLAQVTTDREQVEKELQNISQRLSELGDTEKRLSSQIQISKDSLANYEDRSAEVLKKLNSLTRDVKDKEISHVSLLKENEELNNKNNLLQSSYKEKKAIYDSLIRQIGIYNHDVRFIEMGLYTPVFDFDNSEKYKEHITSIRDAQKELISKREAVVCHTNWTVDNSRREGRKMTTRNMKLASRAFNNECDAIISKVRWNNIETMKERLKASYEAINKLNEPNKVYITTDYLKLKMDELLLTYEYKEQKQKEKEEQQAIMRQMREEAQLERDIIEAEKEEEKYSALLEKAKKEAYRATGEQLQVLTLKIKCLEDDLKVAQEKNKRAMSMAEQTRAGYVYVLSNLGSFGENIYKIGMTRRLEPMDRVRELSDASVPFRFDVHAMIFSEDAPTLEKDLHRAFEASRVNMANYRKEFFKVSLSDIEAEAKKVFPNADFIETIEAREYNETLTIRKEQESNSSHKDVEFPASI